ncbi:MAG: hypothetical protein AAB851_02660 [Patescibacteria group bacterium]
MTELAESKVRAFTMVVDQKEKIFALRSAAVSVAGVYLAKPLRPAPEAPPI